MLSLGQRNTVFGLFIAATAGFLVLEGYMLWSIVANGVDITKAFTTIITTSVLAGCGKVFLSMLNQHFLKSEILPMRRLQRLISERNTAIDDVSKSGQNTYDARRSLITGTLKFGEETLRGWIPGSHFELCVFVDPEQPLLFSYYDSNHDKAARSMSHREKNPTFYIEKGYEVTAVLKNPTSHSKVVQDTQNVDSRYVFTTDEQRKQVRSTLLHCLDLYTPCALVITSNEPNAFPEKDEQFMSFIKFIGSLIRYDLFEGDFIRDIRIERPTLFGSQAQLGQLVTASSNA
ncbi:hypothetical protein [Rhizobium sp. Root1220]|uniref:hypothetical protein n=1 Tax=Rhizobium sp. Root1220 TaxID=1736432 RepID=UPI0006F341CA|nr:hypothetical protein [Rhizobium sp. Root1220]KQV78112.1 hypothetical protein ASC90_27180 [Rhizobium sp. Root1220]